MSRNGNNNGSQRGLHGESSSQSGHVAANNDVSLASMAMAANSKASRLDKNSVFSHVDFIEQQEFAESQQKMLHDRNSNNTLNNSDIDNNNIIEKNKHFLTMETTDSEHRGSQNTK